MDSESATLNTMFSTPACASLSFNIFDNNIGPICEIVTLIGKPFSPNKSQNSTGYPLKLNPLDCKAYFSTRFVTFSLDSPAFAKPAKSPFISATNTGTPISLNDSANAFSV